MSHVRKWFEHPGWGWGTALAVVAVSGLLTLAGEREVAHYRLDELEAEQQRQQRQLSKHQDMITEFSNDMKWIRSALRDSGITPSEEGGGV